MGFALRSRGRQNKNRHYQSSLRGNDASLPRNDDILAIFVPCTTAEASPVDQIVFPHEYLPQVHKTIVFAIVGHRISP